jgi:hypothetical protein
VKRRIPALFVTLAIVGAGVLSTATHLGRFRASAPASPFTLEPRIDDPALARLVARLPPGAHVLRAVAVDVDRDGDLDVIATTTDDILAVWVNEGEGHFSRGRTSDQPNMLAPADVAGGRSGDAAQMVAPRSGQWHGDLTRRSFSVDSDRPERAAIVVVAGARTGCVTSRHGRAPPSFSALS